MTQVKYSPGAQPYRSIEELISRLASPFRNVRQDAARQLRLAGAAAVEPLILRLRFEAQTRRKKRMVGLIMAVTGSAIYLSITPLLFDPSNWVLLLLPLPITAAIMRLNASSYLQIQAISLLTDLADVRAVGPLADALESRDLWAVSSTTFKASDSLVRLLPQITEQDGHLLSQEQRRCLYRSLNHAGVFNPELTAAVVRAMAIIGDSTAIRPLERLLRNRWFVGRHNGLQTELEAAIAAIKGRAVEALAPAMLLRAAQPESMPELLLRPAQGKTPDPDQLLRATFGDIEGADFSEPHIVSTPETLLEQQLQEASSDFTGLQAEGFTDGSGYIAVAVADAEIDSLLEARTVGN